MIASFKDKTTQDIYDGTNSKEARKVPKELHLKASKILDAINAIKQPEDVKAPPSLRLHKLSSSMKGFWSVSINMPWKVIFKFKAGEAFNVQILNYHN